MKNEASIKALAECLKAVKPSDYKIVSPVIAQAILETGWLDPANPLVKVYNYFGMKCGGVWKGKRVNCKTFEYVDGNKVNITDDFRAYDSMVDGCKGYYDFINWSNYDNLRNVKDYVTYCNNLQKDNWATAPNYANILIQIIQENKLYLFDEYADSKVNDMADNVKIIQATLNVSGYNCGNVDGLLGDKTISALNKFMSEVRYGK